MKIFFLILFFSASCAAVIGQGNTTKAAIKNSPVPKTTDDSSYNIHVTIEPFKNCWMYLGSYHGKNKILADSAWFEGNSEATFKGKKKLPGGIYFFVSPSHTLLFEILMDEEQKFTVKADSAHLDNTIITGSKENELFTSYTKFVSKISPQLNALQLQFQNAKTKADSVAIQ